jgi:sensor c-di-GMP phosphodiesterase-like protein
LGSFERFLARRELAIQAAMMLRGFREGYESARADLAKLPSFDELNCQNEISTELSRKNFDNQYVRWFGVARNRNVICRGPQVGVDFSNSHFHQVDEVWSIISTKSPANTDNLMVAQKRGDLLYLAMLEPLLFDFMHAVDCKVCVSYHFIVRAQPEVDMESKPSSASTVISYMVEGIRLGTDMKFTLNATQDYVDAFSFPGRLMSLALAAAFATLTGFVLYQYFRRRTSVAFLIERGLVRNEFLPYYQPIIDSRDGSVLGAEALVRWQMDGRKLIPPAHFIPYAEENRLIEPITHQLVEKVLDDIERFGWRDSGRFISINAVAEQITDSPFCKSLMRRLAEKNIPSKSLSVEITERHQLPDLERGRIALQGLVEAGVEIQLDDSGTGFGGFSYVQELPIETLKIDKMFVDTLRREGSDPKREVLQAIIEFARAAELKVIAEGVETEGQVARLGEAGVFAIQGYVYAAPMSAENFIGWMKSRSSISTQLV